MKMSNFSITWRLIAICILLVTIPIVVLGILSYRSFQQEIFLTIEEKLREQVLMVSEQIETAEGLAEQAETLHAAIEFFRIDDEENES